MLYIICFVPFLILSLWAQHRVGSTFRAWSQVQAASNRTGAEVARAILDRNGLQDVEVRAVPGELSDHYDPSSRTVNLSDPVFSSRSVAAVAVAAHEVGHAIQHQKAYAPLAIRSALVPAAQFGSTAAMPLLMIGLILAASGSVIGQTAMLAGIAMFGAAVLFQLVTLPVEFDASRRARAQLSDMDIAPNAGQEAKGTAKVLNAAALTYVAAALAAVAQLFYFVLQFVVARD